MTSETSMGAGATLFLGPDVEQLQTARDSRHFPTLEDAVRFAVEELPTDRRNGASIEAGALRLTSDQIEAAYKALKGGAA